jgi:hypothetical protein
MTDQPLAAPPAGQAQDVRIKRPMASNGGVEPALAVLMNT